MAFHLICRALVVFSFVTNDHVTHVLCLPITRALRRLGVPALPISEFQRRHRRPVRLNCCQPPRPLARVAALVNPAMRAPPPWLRAAAPKSALPCLQAQIERTNCRRPIAESRPQRLSEFQAWWGCVARW